MATIYGGDGNDTLRGGTGIDSLVGGQGDDVYIIDYNTSDIVVEDSGQGYDTVRTAFSYLLQAQVEHLVLTGLANTKGTGNALANYIVGNPGDNRLTGGAGNDTLDGAQGADTLAGGSGNDTYFVNSSTDIVIEDAGKGRDTVLSTASTAMTANVEILILQADDLAGTGTSANDLIISEASRNLLLGGDGNDTLHAFDSDTLAGGLGNDHYHLNTDDGSQVIELEGEGTDTLYLTFSENGTWLLQDHLENVVLQGDAEGQLVGNALDNRLTGNGGNNTLNGGDGNDLLRADGKNEYFINNNLLDGGDGNDTLYGNAGDDSLLGGAGNDVIYSGGLVSNTLLDGGSGADTLYGGYSQDTFVVDSTNDVLKEKPDDESNGSDTVLTSVSWTLGSRFESLEGFGDNRLFLGGNDKENYIALGAGGGTVNGYGGDDYILGSDADDYLNAGADGGQLTGGGGGDRFIIDRFDVDADYPWITKDVISITDFSHDQPDEYIRLDSNVFTSLSPGTLSNDSFAYNRPAQDADDFILYYTGGWGELYYDPDGSGSATPVLLAWLDNDEVITASDIKVV